MSSTSAHTGAPEAPLFDSVETAIRAVAEGRPIVVTDDEDRENEGDIVLAAEKATATTVNMLIQHARGLVCVPMAGSYLQRLGIGEMVPQNRESFRTAFAVSVDAAEGITTGISAADRTRTIHLLADPRTRPEQLVQPGHIFPLYARPGGVLERAGHTEAAVDLAVLAGLRPCGVICEIIKEDGTMARLADLQDFKRRFGMPLISIAQLIEYRHRNELLIERVRSGPLQTEWGEWTLHVFRERLSGRQHFALTLGNPNHEPTLVRVHRMDLAADVFRAPLAEGGTPLASALDLIRREGRGVLVYLQCDAAQLLGVTGSASPTSGNQLRQHGIGAQILSALGLRRIRLITSNPRKVVGLDGFGLELVEQLSA